MTLRALIYSKPFQGLKQPCQSHALVRWQQFLKALIYSKPFQGLKLLRHTAKAAEYLR